MNNQKIKCWNSRYASVYEDRNVAEIREQDLAQLQSLAGFCGSRAADEKGYLIVEVENGSVASRTLVN